MPFPRRVLLKLAGFAGLALALGPRRAAGRVHGAGFLTAGERHTLAAVMARLIPADDDPGALELGGVDYVDGLLGAFVDYDAGRAAAPRIFGGGPFSGRHGGAPRFGRFLRLTRVQEIAWRTRIEGSRGLAEREFNGPVRGLQELYRTGLTDLDARAAARAGVPFAALAATDRDAVLRQADADFVHLMLTHAIEACYAPPEYGGNRGLRGWALVQFEGDRQPVGYSRYDATLGRYVELARTPISEPDPGPNPFAEAGARQAPRPAVTNPFVAAREAAHRALRLARDA